MLISLSQPQVVKVEDTGDFFKLVQILNNPVTNRAYCAKCLGDLRLQKKRTSFGMVVYHIPIRNNEGLLFYMSNKQIEYFVRYAESPSLTHTEFKSLKQAKIWRASESQPSKDLLPYVFFNVLMKRFGRMVTDEVQTDGGRRMWNNFVFDEAFARNFRVYWLDVSKEIPEVHEIPNVKVFKMAIPMIWGTAEHFKSNLVLISKDRLERS